MSRNLSLISRSTARDALTAALAVRAAGGVPLIVDPNAPIDEQVLTTPLPEDAAWAALTSGTTGAPKIVVRTEASWRAAFAVLNTELHVRPGDGVWMPVHPVSSMAVFSAAWAQAAGAELRIPDRADAGLSEATIAHVTPAWLQHLVGLLESGVPSTLHTALVGGDTIPPDLRTRAERAGLRVVHYAGAAELSFVAWDRGTGMRAFPGVHTSMCNGHLWVAGPQIALDVIGGTLHTEDSAGQRWATVGDRVVQRDGVLEFLGRADHAILTAGATVIPADVETVITDHPQVSACLVLGQPDAILGQRVVAFVEGTAERTALRAWARTHLPKAARPVQYHLLDRLPRTVSGKIRRVAPEVS